jgi:16S rRNA (guanine(966)-N(2))-methyltransferase RsmD
MRVVAGSARGRRLKTLAGLELRPTADRVKEALFSIVASRFDLRDIEVLDLFAGSGALGIEALSRGAARVTFVEQSAPAVRVLRENLELCGFAERSRVLRMAADRALAKLEAEQERFEGVLLDPPYGRNLAHQALERLGAGDLVIAGGWVVAEYHTDDAIDPGYGALQLTRSHRYGKTGLALFYKGT